MCRIFFLGAAPSDCSGLDNSSQYALTVLHNCVTTSLFSYTDKRIAPKHSKAIRPISYTKCISSYYRHGCWMRLCFDTHTGHFVGRGRHWCVLDERVCLTWKRLRCLCIRKTGTRLHFWLRHCSKSRKVAGSIPSVAIRVFSLT
jgi:hypothetical protein